MAKKNILITELPDLTFDKPGEIIKELSKLNEQAKETTDGDALVKTKCIMNGLVKELVNELMLNYNCSDAIITDLLKTIPEDTGYSVKVNNLETTFSNEKVTVVEVDKAYLTSLGYKSQVDLCKDYNAKSKPYPSGITLTISEIAKFDPKKWDGTDPIAKSTDTNKVSIKSKLTNK